MRPQPPSPAPAGARPQPQDQDQIMPWWTIPRSIFHGYSCRVGCSCGKFHPTPVLSYAHFPPLAAEYIDDELDHHSPPQFVVRRNRVCGICKRIIPTIYNMYTDANECQGHVQVCGHRLSPGMTRCVLCMPMNKHIVTCEICGLICRTHEALLRHKLLPHSDS